MVTTLITEKAALTEIKKLGEGQNVCFAVAFWGAGSANNLKIEATAEAKVLCNLESGCCDPVEIEKLKNMDGVKVRTHSSLHAKVYLSPIGALVGSSNASTNGLALDGESLRGWREANLLVKDEPLLNDLNKWFTERWAEGRNITKPMLAAARMKWADRKRRGVIGEHSEKGLTLLGSALRSPEEYDYLPIYIALHKAAPSKEAIKAVSEYKKNVSVAQNDAASSKDSQEVSFNAKWWTYENWELEPDSWYINCTIRENTTVLEIARTTNPVLSTHFTDIDGDTGVAYIAFKTPMAIPVAGVDLKFSPADRSTIADYAELLWEVAEGDDTGCLLSLAKAARRLRRIQAVKTLFKLG